MEDEKLSDYFDIDYLIKHLKNFKSEQYKSIRHYHLMIMIDQARIPESKLAKYGEQTEYGHRRIS
jgi:hypothetical protein